MNPMRYGFEGVIHTDQDDDAQI